MTAHTSSHRSRSSRRAADSVPHVKDYLRIVLARRWILLSCFVLVVAVATVYVLVQTPVYDATTCLDIEPAKVKVTEYEDVYDPIASGVGGHLAMQAYYHTQYELIVSRPVLEQTFHHFRFGEDERFAGSRDPIPAFKTLFTVKPRSQTRLVDVTFRWSDPELAARVVDHLVGEYIKECRRRKMGVTLGGVKALRAKQEDLLPKVEAKADELQTFMVKHEMVSLEEETQSIISERLRELNQTVSQVRARRVEASSIVANIEQALATETALDDLPEVAENKAIGELKTEYARLQQELAGLSKRFGENHPEVVDTRTRMAAVAEEHQQELDGILAARRAELNRLANQEEALEKEVAAQERRVMEFHRLKIQYRNLKDSYERLNRTYRTINQRIAEIEVAIAAGSKDENIFVVNPAPVPTRVAAPNTRLILGGAGVVGALLGIALSLFVDYLDTTVKTKQDIEQALGIPVLGFIPGVRKGEIDRPDTGEEAPPVELLAFQKPRSPLAEAFRSIRTGLSFASLEHQPGHLVVTSPSAGEGKSLTAINLAYAFATAGKRVVLVDSDMRRARLHRVLGAEQSPGLSNLLAGQCGETAPKPLPTKDVPNLLFLPSGPLPPSPAELLQGPCLQTVADQLGSQFDVVIWDAPPVVNVTDAAILVDHLKNGVLIVRGFYTQRQLAERAVEMLANSSGRLLGCIMNSVDVPRAGAYSYDSYHYYSGYEYAGEDQETKKSRKARRTVS